LEEIQAARDEFMEKVMCLSFKSLCERLNGREENFTDPKIRRYLRQARRAVQRIDTKYGAEALDHNDAFQSGFIEGKLSALRWVLGEDWACWLREVKAGAQ
jgi:hypothetical protein